MHIDKKTLRNIFFGVFGCIVLYWVLNETTQVKKVIAFVGNIISPFITGAAIAFILNVPMRAIEGKLNKVKSYSLRRIIAVVLTFLIVILVVALVFILLIPQLVDTIETLIPQLQYFFTQLGVQIYTFLESQPELMEWATSNGLMNVDWAGLAEKLITLIGNSASKILGSTFSAIGVVASFLMDLVIAIVFAIYCLFQKETLARQGRKLMYAIFSERFSDETIRILRMSNSTFSNFLSGQCIEVLILGVMFAVSMAIFGLPYIPLVSVLVAVTAFIPIVGAFAGCIVGAFLILVNNPLQAVIFVGMFLILQQIEGNMIYPRVVGTSIGLSGMWVLLAVAVGGSVFGVAGMFLMIPFASVLFTLIREFTDRRLKEKEIDGEKLVPQPPILKSGFKERREFRKKNKLNKK